MNYVSQSNSSVLQLLETKFNNITIIMHAIASQGVHVNDCNYSLNILKLKFFMDL